MVLKLLGAGLILSGCTALGFFLSVRKRERLSFIEDMILSLGSFKSEIEIMQTPVPKAIKNCGQKSAEKVFSGDTSSLCDEDLRAFEAFLSGLSAESLEGQMANADMYLSRLSCAEEKARKEYQKEEKLLKSGGVLFGLLIVFVFL